jgi:2-phosphoglycerate kinase
VPDIRVVLIGGTSNVGKSTVAQEVAERFGFDCLSTDRLARHPGRPWRTDGDEVPSHVADHYRDLTVDELISSVLSHYQRLWPEIEELVTARVAGTHPGLVLEGSALWPERVAELRVPHTGAVWLTADAALIRARVLAAAGYDQVSESKRRLVDKFLDRANRYQALMTADIERLGLVRIHVTDERSVAGIADEILEAVADQDAARRHHP